MTAEPSNGSYVSVNLYPGLDTAHVFRRRDDQAGPNGAYCWFSTDEDALPASWEQIIESGVIGYIGMVRQREAT